MRFVLRAAIVAAVVALLGFAALKIPAVQDVLVARVTDHLVGDSPTARLVADDALRVAVCGTASPLPHESRAKACVAVFAAGRIWIVDTGPGSWNRIALWRLDAKQIAGVLFTHFHSDHIGDLGEFDLQTWAAGRPGPLPVYGPPGVERVVAGFEEAYALDADYRTAHHGADLMAPAIGRMEALPITLGADNAPAVVLEANGLRITAFAVNHEPVVPAYGYRFDYRGRSVVVSGDTAKSARLIAAARGADVLVHEAQANHMVAVIRDAAARHGRDRIAKIMADIPSYHTTPVEAAEVANEAGVRLLVLYHLTPPPPNRVAADVLTRGVNDVRSSGWVLADDGLLVELPADSDTVTVGEVE
jgi:ribonuclease Z